jgi:hypothetical protein
MDKIPRRTETTMIERYARRIAATARVRIIADATMLEWAWGVLRRAS